MVLSAIYVSNNDYAGWPEEQLKCPMVTSLRKLYQFYLVVHTSCVMQHIIMYVSVVWIPNVLKTYTHTHAHAHTSFLCIVLSFLVSRQEQHNAAVEEEAQATEQEEKEDNQKDCPSL